MTSATKINSRSLSPVYYAWFGCAVFVVIVLLGSLHSYYSYYTQAIRSDPYGLGQYNLPLQVLIQVSDIASGFISFTLAGVLLRYKLNDRMVVFSSFFFLITAVVSNHSLDYFLTAYFDMPSTYHIWSSLQSPFWILLFCIFPNGRFAPRWMLWVFIASIPLSLAFFAGIDALAISRFVIYPLFFLTAYAQIYRYRQLSNYTERKQTRWVVLSIAISFLLAVIASLIYKQFSPPLINIIPITLTIAVLRYRLWDIDIIIRRTLQYSLLTGLLALVYFSAVTVLQSLFTAVTGQQSAASLVLSTLGIAALFNPLRKRIQDFIDRRFYRQKYDAEKALAAFAEAARSETELQSLTSRLTATVQDTLQPGKVDLWLRK